MNEWHAIVVQGTERGLRGFVAAFVADHGLAPGSVLLGDDVGLEPASLAERLRDLVGSRGHYVVLLRQDHATAFTEALQRGGAAAGLAAGDRHAVARAWFDYRAEVFARDVASTLVGALAGLPAGVAIENRVEREERHDDAQGV